MNEPQLAKPEVETCPLCGSPLSEEAWAHDEQYGDVHERCLWESLANTETKIKRSLSGHQSSKMQSDVWLTPQSILKPLGEFDLDPCTIPDHPWQIGKKFFTLAEDGLSQSWAGRVWMNPPFSSAAIAWMRKLAEHGDGIALIAARTETRMFFECVWGKARGICFLKGRPHFHRADGTRAKANSGAPICLVAYGFSNAEILERCGLGKHFYL